VSIPLKAIGSASGLVFGGRSSRLRRRALVVVVRDVLGEDMLEVADSPDEEMIQALGPSREDPPLGVGIGVRGSNGSLDDLSALRLEYGGRTRR
jgi:hypothetical protein